MNNLRELKARLLEIHEKDKKQTITALIVAETAAILLLILVFTSMVSGGSKLPAAVYFMLSMLVIGPLIPYIIMLGQAAKRRQKIEEFIGRLESGEQVSNINTYTDYKLILPFRLIRIRLFPMEYAQVVLGPDRKSYKLPLSEENVQPFRALLSLGSGVQGNTSANWAGN
ncbi:MAG TPA: hypothetical protein VM802_05480 [Chitinophaga sp.]|uniref:hypothetical protein n=1 Tax=Chitinophaga sp. TaxID=1869181 RepID=UPI002D086E65|nr:hypothetical protein [Chitinophaga sp.]HVI44295.1 hypothetical protein [Chitinophaga sp.]